MTWHICTTLLIQLKRYIRQTVKHGAPFNLMEVEILGPPRPRTVITIDV